MPKLEVKRRTSRFMSLHLLPVCPPSEFVSGGVIRVDFDGFVAVPDAGVGSFQLEEAVAPLGEHGRGLGVEEDGFGEEVGRFLEVTRCGHFRDSYLRFHN